MKNRLIELADKILCRLNLHRHLFDPILVEYKDGSKEFYCPHCDDWDGE